jgi:hypothetical protein
VLLFALRRPEAQGRPTYSSFIGTLRLLDRLTGNETAVPRSVQILL